MKNLYFLLFFLSFSSYAQDLTQSIRGNIFDTESDFPIPGAKIQVLGIEPPIRALSDLDGNFLLEKVPLGRINLLITYAGYEPLNLQNLELISGKELIVNVGLTEQISTLEEVVVQYKDDKSNTVNDLSTVSARKISVEEAGKFAGTLNDPARMAQNYAGVSGVSDSRNDIIIRGNSPLGVLWRLEGIDIPSPNHFSSLGTTGGPISMLNINNLSNSDFFTSAWSADYGNALSGVFDLRLRNGNSQKREHLAQVGFNGFEFGAEGPFVKGKRASYLINYRYSTLGVLGALGINLGVGAAIPEYQDLTIKMNFPTKKAGNFTLWGIGGVSDIEFLATGEVDSTNLYASPYEDSRFSSNTAVIGASHKYFLNENTFSELILAASYTNTIGAIDSVSSDAPPFNTTGFDRTQTKYSANYKINHKFSAKAKLTVGAIFENYQVDMQDSSYIQGNYVVYSKFIGGSSLIQSYVNYQYKFNEKFLINGGLHSQHFMLTKSNTLEPRIGLKYKANVRNTFGLGGGIHSQIQPISIYFTEKLENGVATYPNQKLDFTKALHSVLSYDFQFSENMRFKTEAYYQFLYDLPVDSFPSAFSMINQGADFVLPNGSGYVNQGEGSNYGLELTFERFLKKGFYYLVTTSIFQSQYAGSDGIERNTAFNGNYIINGLAGKEFKLSQRFTLGFDARVSYAGGRRYTPIDLDASIAAGREIVFLDQLYEAQHPNYFRFDFKTTFKHNGKKLSQEFSVDLQNLSNQKNVFQSGYNDVTKKIGTVYQRGFFPNVQYKINF
jgi:CarboxypepD_reg-like domain